MFGTVSRLGWPPERRGYALAWLLSPRNEHWRDASAGKKAHEIGQKLLYEEEPHPSPGEDRQQAQAGVEPDRQRLLESDLSDPDRPPHVGEGDRVPNA